MAATIKAAAETKRFSRCFLHKFNSNPFGSTMSEPISSHLERKIHKNR